MNKTRLEAFSDGVIAILITIMVLELRIPEGADWNAVRPELPVFVTYVLSFVILGIYWNNHHHLIHAADRITGTVLWANLHLLFWLSLVPAATAWMGSTRFASVPTALYGVPLLMAALAWLILQRTIIAADGRASVLAEALGKDWKGKFSFVLYIAAIVVAMLWPWVAWGIYAVVAMLWIVPDRRIERALVSHARSEG